MDKFFQTDSGKAFLRFEAALGRAWQADENSSDRVLKERWDAAERARAEFLELLKARDFSDDTP